MTWSRRDLSLLVPALAAAAAASAQDTKAIPGKAYRFEDLPVKESGLNKSRAVFDGVTHSGYPVELHMTSLAPGQMPHPAHRHPNEEVMLVRSGQLDATCDGRTSRLTPGSVIYMPSMSEHGLKNPGPEVAEYFVIALGDKKA
jgi:mannose-6-phosphate isomerase-like protein (cupin superfamily)